MSGYHAANPHYAPDDFSEARERFERCEEKAGALFAGATVAQTTLYHRAMTDLRGLSAPRYDRARDAAKAQFERTTTEASDLCEETVRELMLTGEISESLYDRWEALERPRLLQAAE